MAHIRRLPNKKYVAEVKRGGRRFSKTHVKRGVVAKWATDLEAKLDAGERVVSTADGRVTVGDWWERWIASRVLEKSTTDTYRSAYRLHIEPTLGRQPIAQLTRMDVDAWLAGLARKGLGGRTQQIALVVVSQLLGSAMEEGIRPDNPAVRVRKPRSQAAEPMFLSRGEAVRLLEHMDDRMALVMLFCGLRWSEAAALKPDAIDWLRGHLIVKRVKTKHGVRELVGKSAKARRTIPLPVEVKDELAALVTDPDGWMFPSPSGDVWDYSNWRRRVYLPARKAAKLPGVTPHDLRHTYASWLVEAGIDLYRVQILMGHSSPRMTMRYAHLRPDHFDAVAEVLSSGRKAIEG